MDLTALNTAKAILVAKKVTAGVMQTDVLKYYIPLDEVEVLFTEVASALTELDGRISTLEEQMANRMLCVEYKVEE